LRVINEFGCPRPVGTRQDRLTGYAMSVGPISGMRRILGVTVIILGALLAWRILWLCRLNWAEHYGEESRNRMVLWFWLSWAAVAAGIGIAFKKRAALVIAGVLAVVGVVAMFTYPLVFSPPIAPY
jgi:hypothetical protein